MSPKPLILPEPQDIDMLQKSPDSFMGIRSEVSSSIAADSCDDSVAIDANSTVFDSLTAVYL